jgi:large subunit ribosomal protein L24
VDIRRNDNVKVITGRDKGKEGRVLRVFPNDSKLLVEHVMMVKKARAPESAAQY